MARKQQLTFEEKVQEAETSEVVGTILGIMAIVLMIAYCIDKL